MAQEAAGSSPVTHPKIENSECSAARLAHLLWEQGVGGSNPLTPTEVKPYFSRESEAFLLGSK